MMFSDIVESVMLLNDDDCNTKEQNETQGTIYMLPIIRHWCYL